MIQADLISINHLKSRHGAPIVGGIVREFMVGMDDVAELDSRWCDMAPLYHIWKHKDALEPEWPVPPIIGFHGYRKHINFRDQHAVLSWEEVDAMRFRAYQEWLIKELTGDKLNLILHAPDVDVITVKPFNCSYNLNIAEDYRRSRSAADWAVFEDVMKAHGTFDFSTPFIRPMHFVCEDYIFFKWMRFFDKVRQDLEPLIKSKDAHNELYPLRALAFLAERMWSLWLDTSGFRIKEFPLMICWSPQ
jgi:hypothetical protein